MPPVSDTASQPGSVVAPSLNCAVPPGPCPVTVAVNVTPCPNVAGLPEVASVVVVAATLTTCDSGDDVDGEWFASPPYSAVIECVPAARSLRVHCALPF